MKNLVSTDWLEKNLDNVRIFDGSWHLPNSSRNALDEFKSAHIKNYRSAKPYKSVIKLINKLFNKGHFIKIFTARYMGRNNDNIKAARKEGYKMTLEQLKSWNLKFHKLIFGKPSFDILIDDREDTIERWETAGGKGIHYKNAGQVINDLKKSNFVSNTLISSMYFCTRNCKPNNFGKFFRF